MALPTDADVIVVRGFWIDEITGQGVKTPSNTSATITFDPVPLTGGSTTTTPNLRDATFSAYLKTRQRVATVDATTGYFATLLVASNDPDLDAYGGRRVTMLGETPFVIEAPHNAPTVTVDAAMATATGLTQGSSVGAIWLVDAALVTTPAPTPTNSYLTSEQTLSTLASGIEAHDEDPDAHADMRAALSAGLSEQARDALGTALTAGANVTITPNDGADTITIAVSGLTEAAQDAVAALIASGTHSGISFSYNDAGDAISATVAAQSWSQITGKPTFAAVATSGSASDITTGTLADAQIASTIARDSEVTSAVSAASTTDRDRANHTGTQSADTVVDGTTNKAYTATEKTKLAGVANAATANAADATLLARANHTGTQVSTTISDFTEAVQDAVAALLGAGSNITLNYDDAGNTLTVTGSGAGGLDAEAVRDAIGVAVVGVGNIAVTVNDGADTITISTTATVNSTDASLRDRSTHTGTQTADTLTDGSTNKVFTSTMSTKLAGIATAATANDTDANLKARANHTGTQAISTVTGLQTAIDGKQPLDSDLTAIAALAPADGAFLGRQSGAWAGRTPAQVRTDLDVPTTAYVDDALGTARPLQSVATVATSNVTVSAPGSSIGGYTLTNSGTDRVLLTGQSTSSQNGVYVWNGAASALTRATDADTSAEVAGAFLFVNYGDQAQSGWECTDTTLVVGTDPQTWVQFQAPVVATSAGDLVVGTGSGQQQRLAVPSTAGQTLVSDPAQTTKMRWSATVTPAALKTGNRYFCNSPGGTATAAPPLNTPRVSAWLVQHPTSISALGVEFTAAGEATSVFRVVIWNDDGTGTPGTVAIDAGTISTGTSNSGGVTTGGTPGSYEVTGLSTTLQPGLYWAGGIVQGATTTAPTMRTISTFNLPLVPLAIGSGSLPTAGFTIAGYGAATQTGAAATFATPSPVANIVRVFYRIT